METAMHCTFKEKSKRKIICKKCKRSEAIMSGLCVSCFLTEKRKIEREQDKFSAQGGISIGGLK
jgi:hypothetical protein